ncbi:MAG: response regulator transcription factor [Chloroflexi bacterium]|nr:response regulator transcription factor [Chloroflexota bacterium]
MDPIRVLVVDDHLVVREGVQRVLATDASVTVVAEASNGAEAVKAVEDLKPDVVLMDVRMPQMDGVEATRHIKEALPEVAVVMLTMYDDDTYVIEAVEAGAVGYLLKDASRDLLLHTIKAAHNGTTLIKSSVLRAVFSHKMRVEGKGLKPGPGGPLFSDTGQDSGGAWGPGTDSAGPPRALTPRELEVLGHLVQGRANKEIGQALYLTEFTVKKHVASVIFKLGAANRSDAAVQAVLTGLVQRR